MPVLMRCTGRPRKPPLPGWSASLLGFGPAAGAAPEELGADEPTGEVGFDVEEGAERFDLLAGHAPSMGTGTEARFELVGLFLFGGDLGVCLPPVLEGPAFESELGHAGPSASGAGSSRRGWASNRTTERAERIFVLPIGPVKDYFGRMVLEIEVHLVNGPHDGMVFTSDVHAGTIQMVNKDGSDVEYRFAYCFDEGDRTIRVYEHVG